MSNSTELFVESSGTGRIGADVCNILRVCATLFVFLLHGSGSISGLNGAKSSLTWLAFLPAWSGVWIFFFLSGFTIGLGMWNNRYQLINEQGKVSLRGVLKFYYGRFLKIAPIYYGFCLLWDLFGGQAYFANNPIVFIKMLTFTFNGGGGAGQLGHLWYVSTAMQLYLLMPFVYFLINKVRNSRWLVALFSLTVVVGAILRIVLYDVGVDWYSRIYTFAPMNVDLIASGIIFAKIVQTVPTLKRSMMTKLVVALLFVGLVLFNCKIYYSGGWINTRIYRTMLPSAYVLICAAMIVSFYRTRVRGVPTYEPKIKKNPLVLIDRFSPYTYAFYVFHVSVFGYLEQSLLTKDWYIHLPLAARYSLFFVFAFLITLFIAVFCTKMFSWIGNSRKKKVGRAAAQ